MRGEIELDQLAKKGVRVVVERVDGGGGLVCNAQWNLGLKYGIEKLQQCLRSKPAAEPKKAHTAARAQCIWSFLLEQLYSKSTTTIQLNDER